ncbi:hypothetical protein D9M70_482440 [compost metagenome]
MFTAASVERQQIARPSKIKGKLSDRLKLRFTSDSDLVVGGRSDVPGPLTKAVQNNSFRRIASLDALNVGKTQLKWLQGDDSVRTYVRNVDQASIVQAIKNGLGRYLARDRCGRCSANDCEITFADSSLPSNQTIQRKPVN